MENFENMEELSEFAEPKWIKCFSVRRCLLVLLAGSLVLIFLFTIQLYNKNEKVVVKLAESTSFQVSSKAFNVTSPAKIKAKKLIHVVYLTHLSSDEEQTVQNHIYFMNFAYKPCHTDVFYTFIFNVDFESEDISKLLTSRLGKELTRRVNECTIKEKQVIKMSEPSAGFTRNTRIIKRLNAPGSDLCAYTELMVSNYWLKTENWFRYFFFINSVVRGPFLPVYYQKPWWNVFTDMIEYSNDTVAAGPYMSCETNAHIQSFLIAVDRRGLNVMKKVFRCPEPGEDKQKWIEDTEVKLGAEWMKRGYAFRSMLFVHNGMGTPQEIINSNCPGINPFHVYPIRGEHKELIYKNNPNLTSAELFVNIFEVTWVRYRSEHDTYLNQYVPLYTQLMYDRLKKNSDVNIDFK